ncbi:MAG: CsbD family protein [Planctomycetota bacterium]
MKWDDVKKDWQMHRAKVKTRWPKLTPKDLDEIAGKREALLEKLKLRHALAKEQAEKEIEAFLASLPAKVK